MAQAPIVGATPGNIVVSLSAILDQLRGRLTSVELDALLAAVVSRRKNEVHPGDLITADLMNQILLDLQDLNAQVAALSGGTGSAAKNSQVVATLHDAWRFYGALVKSGEFLPTGTSSDAMAAAAEINAYLQDVMYTALAGGTLGYFGAATDLLDAFLRIYEKQHDVVVLFSAPIAGIADTGRHKRFANLLNAILEVDNALGEISLHKALQTQNLTAAIAAQNRINTIVRDEGGDVTTGNLEVLYRGAVGTTETLVIGSTQAVLYRFLVTNKTNRNLAEIQLKAEFLPPRQSWTSFSIVDATGAPRSALSLTPFDSANPSNPSATQEVRVAVTTPSGAANGDKGILQLTAFVPPPINVRASATRELTVANSPTNQTPGIVSFAAGTPVISGNLTTAQPGVPLTLEFEFNFSALTGPTTRSFRFHLDISAPSNPDSSFFVEFAPADAAVDAAASAATRKSSQPFVMTDGATRSVTAVITPLSGTSGDSMTFSARVESATDNVRVQSQAFTITVI